jgi:hypothetical protein
MSLSLQMIRFHHPNHTVKAQISVRQSCRWPCLLAIMLALATTTRISAIPMNITVDNLGGGLFQYNLTLNDEFGDPLSGLNVLHGFSVFGLEDTSVIGAPAGWSFFAPLPPLVDELNWFSLSSATDVPIGGSLSGFFFQSTTDPATLKPGDFVFDVISGRTGLQLPIPEQSNTGLLLTFGLASLLAYGRYWCNGQSPSMR